MRKLYLLLTTSQLCQDCFSTINYLSITNMEKVKICCSWSLRCHLTRLTNVCLHKWSCEGVQCCIALTAIAVWHYRLPTNFNIMAWSARALSHRSKSGSSAGLHRTIIAKSLRHVWLAYKWGRSESTAVVSHSNGHQLTSISCHFSLTSLCWCNNCKEYNMKRASITLIKGFSLRCTKPQQLPNMTWPICANAQTL